MPRPSEGSEGKSAKECSGLGGDRRAHIIRAQPQVDTMRRENWTKHFFETKLVTGGKKGVVTAEVK